MCCTSVKLICVWGTSCLHYWRVCMCVSSRGIFYQGYYCSRCGTGAHKECLEVITICKISRCFLQSLSRKQDSGLLLEVGGVWGLRGVWSILVLNYLWIKSLTTVVWQTYSTSSVVWTLKYSCKVLCCKSDNSQHCPACRLLHPEGKWGKGSVGYVSGFGAGEKNHNLGVRRNSQTFTLHRQPVQQI